jgi:glycosyltransferase involved in cell wall biosynthesis
LEALNSGVPVITSKGGCFSEAGGKNSIYIEPSDIEEIATNIEFLLNNPDKRKKMIDEGLKFALSFREEIIARNIINVYNSVF